MTEQIKHTITALQQNQMQALYAPDKAAACALAEEMMFEGCTICAGGSVSLAESGVEALLRQQKYRFLDRYRPEITEEERQAIFRETVGCDFYFCSANAVTEKGELVNVDGLSNRVSAIAFGPKRVIVLAGINKLVKNVEEGLLRVKRVAAPKNAVRLNLDTPCAKLGHCIALEKSEHPDFTDGCKQSSHICCSYSVSSYQRIKNRITVILCGEELGY